eukprot:1156319-Pelagomonas_calceolata.AAC.3
MDLLLCAIGAHEDKFKMRFMSSFSCVCMRGHVLPQLSCPRRQFLDLLLAGKDQPQADQPNSLAEARESNTLAQSLNGDSCATCPHNLEACAFQVSTCLALIQGGQLSKETHGQHGSQQGLHPPIHEQSLKIIFLKRMRPGFSPA